MPLRTAFLFVYGQNCISERVKCASYLIAIKMETGFFGGEKNVTFLQHLGFKKKVFCKKTFIQHC